jgi:hypothetical protein
MAPVGKMNVEHGPPASPMPHNENPTRRDCQVGLFVTPV